ncbi:MULTISPECIES: glutamine--tRNA ligase/YqeY domain fusion protein [unclassified Mucilaginibacter]|uniref:glutamine--tRNA ligase/YqeY domain fusion protein n=1 Tax=unclassified Mucilaginibacter TaxID=2617802 RepID=UPI002AC9B809|nr:MULTISPECIES: glutamine--tRNA ligase/YqeY domain fusion protein [unclassified Mucilaginibacter]MEB0248766.1 glutamine--tRNA ligase/YqeY domain fusion protein [Mucilaginibacter sp. 5B2]MEB0263692.1 glutamine--tRNA ligase/YqeY domain fusion protein [Mucilaginibacter sp. 10I4]MEB0280795.1 glutamine--tRNA ligase/YqeY domain fusion protein [Mucilaginibacter sp. 10B2]MEB0303067.1 glutamine--tRNA ligase/YqeY domain fusion protein [Mucilaginibacter sp. 5C4]WPX24337.1 glutamine--tRNA ligase/YqeY dom
MSEERSLNFIEEIVEADIAAGKNDGRVLTRFPPEPNGYLHIGHAKSICLNFGLAKKYNGKTNLRFDDTNPAKEEVEYVDSIKEDVKWLGFEWAEELYASDYFDQLYALAAEMIKQDLAYVDDSTAEEIAIQKGTPTEAGVANEYRSRPIEENLQLFADMKAGKYPDGAKVLRAKLDLTSTNMQLRDPLMYRIKHTHHHRTGDAWCIYPMYDFAHGQSDAIEHITHSICTVEFIPHRPLYEWFIEKLNLFPSKQYEFARLNLNYTVMSKRKLLQLVEEGHVDGWDDPRMPTISGLRRRGYTPASIREFCERIGVAKRENMIDVGLLEFCIREDLNKTAWRRMAVLDPVKLVINNYPEGKTEIFHGENNPEVEGGDGSREFPFGRELWIERDDFMEEPTKKYFRLGIGLMVRLKSAYIIKGESIVKDAGGNITEIHCSYIPESQSGNDTSGINVKGTIHWVSADHARSVEVRLYDRLFQVEDPGSEDGDFKEYINPNSLHVLQPVYVEPDLANAPIGTAVQFMRKGYFTLDKNSTSDNLVFNRTVTLKDGWVKKG